MHAPPRERRHRSNEGGRDMRSARSTYRLVVLLAALAALAVSPGTALAQNGTPGGKDDAKKARADKSHKDGKKDGDSERRSEKPKKDTTTPNQGETSKVLTVSGMSCPSPVPGSKVEGGRGTTISVSSSLPIARVTLKSGNSATVVGASFSADFKSATITLSKDVSNYIVWTCASSGGEKPDACPNLEG